MPRSSIKTPAPPSRERAFRQLIRTFGLIERVMQPYFAQFGISGAQWGVLRNLHRAEVEGLRGLRHNPGGEWPFPGGEAEWFENLLRGQRHAGSLDQHYPLRNL